MKRGCLKGVICLVSFLVISGSVLANHTELVKQSIIKQSKELGVEPAIMKKKKKMESGFNQNIKSSSGHIGVFQLSGATAKNMGLDPYKLDDNVKGGIIYYKNMYSMFNSMELAVAAYNAGPDAIKRNNNNIPKYSQHFVNRIIKDYNHYKNMGI